MPVPILRHMLLTYGSSNHWSGHLSMLLGVLLIYTQESDSVGCRSLNSPADRICRDAVANWDPP